MTASPHIRETQHRQTLPALFAALTSAAHKHSGQLRKSAGMTPYINHPIAVAEILAREGGVGDANTLAAALLHDTLEDTDTTAAELKQHFGAGVAGIVVELTDDMDLPKPERKARQITLARGYSVPARLVRIADKIANIRDVAYDPPVHWSIERRMHYLQWAAEVLTPMRGTHDALERCFDKNLLDGLNLLTGLAGNRYGTPDPAGDSVATNSY